jgi:hypothetical protein
MSASRERWVDQQTAHARQIVDHRDSIRRMPDAELAAELDRSERQARIYDAAEGRQWFQELAERDAHFCWLMWLRDETEDRRRTREADQEFITDGQRVLGKRLYNHG